MMDRQNGKFIIECNGCGDTLDTEEGIFGDALTVMKDTNWRSVPPTRTYKEWQHYCDKCGVSRQGAVR
jgi:hypothetical protein